MCKKSRQTSLAALVFAVASLMSISCTGSDMAPGDTAPTFAIRYIQPQYGTVNNVFCSDKDNNGDGFVVCVVLFKPIGLEGVKVANLECPVNASKGVACKKAVGNLKNK